MAKVYAIFYDDTHMYFPIKREGYCEDMPQFFGGRVNGGESKGDALRREIKEESQGKYSFPSGVTITLDDTEVHSGEFHHQTYYFYKILMSEGLFVGGYENPFPGDSTTCELPEANGETDAEREHKCILKIAKDSFDAPATSSACVTKLIAICNALGYCDSNGEGYTQFTDTTCLTKEAFRKFFKGWFALDE